jgi:hypothetical protein
MRPFVSQVTALIPASFWSPPMAFVALSSTAVTCGSSANTVMVDDGRMANIIKRARNRSIGPPPCEELDLFRQAGTPSAVDGATC